MTGSGTLTDPFIIYDVNDLQNMQLVPLAYYELGNDIDASATVGWNGGHGFIPIDQSAGLPVPTPSPYNFPYTFDGKGHKITNLYQNWDDGTAGGLFYALMITVKNLELKDVNITNAAEGANIGALAADVAAAGVILENIKVSGIIKTDAGALGSLNFTGGLVGRYYLNGTWTIFNTDERLTIRNVEVDATITYSMNEGGGIVANAKDVDFIQCSTSGSLSCRYFDGSLSAEGFSVGGIAAWGLTCTFNTCTSTMDIYDTNAWYIGGVAGRVRTFEIGILPTHKMALSCKHSSFRGTLTNRVGGIYAGGLIAGVYGEDAYPSFSLIEDCHVQGTLNLGSAFGCGGLVGLSDSTNYKDCDADVGLVCLTGAFPVGGLVADLVGCATMEYCHSSGSITGDIDAAGGLIGKSRNGLWPANVQVTDSYSTIDINPTASSWMLERAGGFVDLPANVDFHRCYATGSINNIGFMPSEYVGGFCGRVDDHITTTFTDCYARGDVSGTDKVGGFAGGYACVLTNCYSTGKVTLLDPSGAAGGLAGDDVFGDGTAVACFWDIQTSGQPTSAGGTGKTTAQMKYKRTFSNAGWDFRRIWGIKPSQNNGYPFFGRGRHSPIPSAPNIPLEPFRRADVY
jgi:hypothetical protein